jgi:hypothetical protein
MTVEEKERVSVIKQKYGRDTQPRGAIKEEISLSSITSCYSVTEEKRNTIML